jgi:deazaflavin-dependent oxidoreductase (nitroreductase family)
LSGVDHPGIVAVRIAAVDILDVAERSWPVLRRAAGLHTGLYRWTGGRIGHTLPGLPTLLLLDHVGARSGRHRTTPLLYFRDGRNLAIVASKGGHPRHPAWYHNLRANPETTVQVRAERRPVRARVAGREEHERLWPKALEVYPGFRGYQGHAAARQIPIVLLEPR